MAGANRALAARVSMASLLTVALLGRMLGGCSESDSNPSDGGLDVARAGITTSTGTWVDTSTATDTGPATGNGTGLVTSLSTGQGTWMIGTSVCTLCGLACCVAGEACSGLGPTSDGVCSRTSPITSTWSATESTPPRR